MQHKVEAWAEEQKRLVELGGRTACSFLLEGPDGKTWATFPAAAPELGSMMVEAQRGLEAQLAAGQTHQAKWVSLDHEGQQLACLPVVLRGQSSDAAGAAKDALAFTRATSQHLMASEQLVTMYKNLCERLSRELEDERQENTELREALHCLREANSDVELERIKTEGGERRFDAALDEMKPLLGIAVNIVGEKVMKWVKDKEAETNGAKRKRKRKPSVESGSRAPDAGAGASGTTPESRIALHAEPERAQAAVRRSRPRSNGGAPGGRTRPNGAARSGAASRPAAKGPRKAVTVNRRKPTPARSKTA